MARATWSGSISFGLVNVRVKAYTAVRDHDVHFHQLEKKTGARIRHEKVSDKSGKPVDNDKIEMGYEVSKGRYVTFEQEELNELRPASTRSIEVSDFVPLDQIDPIYYTRTYWLAPADDESTRAYRLLLAAMEDEERVAIGTVVMRNKQYLAAIRPLDGALAMSTMRFEDEVVDRREIDDIPQRRSKPDRKELALAKQILESLTSDWNAARYRDTYTDELKERIAKKAKGDEVVAGTSDEPEGKVLDLMEALEASVTEAKKARSGRRATKRKSA
jgi:DNA end-binding protein Ku